MTECRDNFLEFVVKEANRQGKEFILDSGEGNDFNDPLSGWYIEDLSGWLVDFKLKDELLSEKKWGNAYRKFSDYYVFVKWRKETGGKINVDFIKYPSTRDI